MRLPPPAPLPGRFQGKPQRFKRYDGHDDKRYVEGSSTPIALRAALSGLAGAIEYVELEYYRLLKYEVAA